VYLIGAGRKNEEGGLGNDSPRISATGAASCVRREGKKGFLAYLLGVRTESSCGQR